MPLRRRRLQRKLITASKSIEKLRSTSTGKNGI